MKIKVDGKSADPELAEDKVRRILSALPNEDAISTGTLVTQSGLPVNRLHKLRSAGFELCVLWGAELAWANPDTIKFMKGEGAK